MGLSHSPKGVHIGPSRAAIYNKRTETPGRRNQDLRCEVLTQKATAELFGTTEAAVRHAIRSGSVDVELRVSPSLAGRTASLLELDSVRDCWCHRSPDDVEAQLEHMRRDHLVLAASPAWFMTCCTPSPFSTWPERWTSSRFPRTGQTDGAEPPDRPR